MREVFAILIMVIGVATLLMAMFTGAGFDWWLYSLVMIGIGAMLLPDESNQQEDEDEGV